MYAIRSYYEYIGLVAGKAHQANAPDLAGHGTETGTDFKVVFLQQGRNNFV